MNTPTMTTEEAAQRQEKHFAEQRRARRHSYTCRQLVAPFDGVRPPLQDEFDWAMFNDVSETGVSFLSSSVPATKKLVVAIGPAPFSFLIVDVVRIVPREDQEEHSYHIGCTVVGELTE
jgi:hypothetical protein